MFFAFYLVLCFKWVWFNKFLPFLGVLTTSPDWLCLFARPFPGFAFLVIFFGFTKRPFRYYVFGAS